MLKRLVISAAALFTLNGTAFASSPLFIVSASGLNVSIQSTVPNHTYPNAGIKVNTSGYSLANPGTDCALASNGYCLFPVSSSTSRTIALSGATGDVSITVCLNGLGPLSCQSYTVSVTGSSAYRFAYITSPTNNLVKKCVIGTAGALSSCTSVGTGFNTPEGIVLNSGGTRAYVTNYIGNSVSLCSINASGNFNSCTDSGAGSTFNTPLAITLSPDNLFAYIANYTGNVISRCAVSPSNGTLSSCSGTTYDVSHPAGIVLNSGGTLAYITNSFTNTVSKCSVTAGTGALTGCTDSGNTGSAFLHPLGITLNSGGNLAYVANQGTGGSGAVSACPITTGNFGSCMYEGDVEHPIAVTLNEADDVAYVAGTNNKIYLCPLDINGSMSTCSDSGITGLQSPYSIALLN